MPTQTSELQLFLASPGDLPEERTRVREVAERFNQMCGVNVGIRIRVSGWEDVAPDLGRPQALINPLVDSCDLFVGLLHKRWGSESGEADSGFSEEWERAAARRIGGGSPRMALFLKQIDPADEDDPGVQLRKVLDFRSRIELEHVALFRRFRNADDLERQLYDCLIQLLTKPAREAPPPDASVPSEQFGLLAQIRVQPGALNPGQEQGIAVLDGFRQLLGGQGQPASVDTDRFLLLALAVQSEGVIPTHVANRLFLRRASLALLVLEAERWLETLAADYDSNDAADMVIPGWQIVSGGDKPSELCDLVLGSNKAAASGALKMLTAMKARPPGLWSREEVTGELERSVTRWRSLLAEPWSALTAMEYLTGVAALDDVALLHALTAVANGESFGREVSALTDVLEGKTGSVAESVVSGGAPTWAQIRLEPLVSQLPDDTVRLLMSKGRLQPSLRVAAFDELAARGLADTAVLETALADNLEVVRERAMQFVESNRAMAPGLFEALAPSKADGVDAVRPRLLALSTSGPDLRRSSASILAHDQWAALLVAEPEAMAAEARALLRSRDDFAARAAAELPSSFAEGDKLVAYLYAKRVAAAARLLARLPVGSREVDDGSLVRQAVDTLPSWLKPDALITLGDLGDSCDAPTLVEAAKRTYSGEKASLLSAAIRLGGLEFARSMCDDDDGEVATAGIRALAADANLGSGDFEPYLRHENAHVRMAALEAVVARSSRTDLVGLLDRYVATSPYYYNVSAGLDRYLFAPEPIGHAPSTSPNRT